MDPLRFSRFVLILAMKRAASSSFGQPLRSNDDHLWGEPSDSQVVCFKWNCSSGVSSLESEHVSTIKVSPRNPDILGTLILVSATSSIM